MPRPTAAANTQGTEDEPPTESQGAADAAGPPTTAVAADSADLNESGSEIEGADIPNLAAAPGPDHAPAEASEDL
eukprot:9772135-Heterocapsa_arctica.AAC.1